MILQSDPEDPEDSPLFSFNTMTNFLLIEKYSLFIYWYCLKLS